MSYAQHTGQIFLDLVFHNTFTYLTPVNTDAVPGVAPIPATCFFHLTLLTRSQVLIRKEASSDKSSLSHIISPRILEFFTKVSTRKQTHKMD